MPPVYARARGEDARARVGARADADIDRCDRRASARASVGARATEDVSMAARGTRVAQCGD
jgi:hypothetical protein